MKFIFALYCVIFFWKSTGCHNAGYVVGGREVSIRDYPYMAQLRRYGHFICGASIISASWILTAGHCTYKGNPDDMDVRVGTDLLSEGGVVIKIKKNWEHPNYNNKNLDYDVAVSELVNPIPNNIIAKPIKVVSIYDFPEIGRYASVAGWGKNSSHLRAVSLPVLDFGVCKNWYQGRVEIKDFVMCAGFKEGNKGACVADSGGPLVFAGLQIGIVSRSSGCAEKMSPGVFTAVAAPSVRRFIRKTAGV